MNLDRKLTALEKALRPDGVCTVQYKAVCGAAGEHEMPLEKALRAAWAGRLKSIVFPLSFHERQAERASGRDLWEEIAEDIEGIKRDTSSPAISYNLVLCSKPVIYARQAPPKFCAGHYIGGYFLTEDGEEFHQTQWQELLKRRGAGFIIVLDYDESREPWYTAKTKPDI